VDELHLYRGTAGTEIAYLLRLLLDRLGLHPGSPKLRVLASSASLDPSDAASRDFLAQFFGCNWLPAQIVTGALEPIPSVPGGAALPAVPFANLTHAMRADESANIDVACNQIADALGTASPSA